MTEPPTELTAEEIHQYDQAWAASKHLLASYVEHYRGYRDENRAMNIPDAVTIVGMSIALIEYQSVHLLSSALTAAVVQIVESMDTCECDGCHER